MADDVDIANDAMLADIERRIAAQRIAEDRPTIEDCEDCGEPVHIARQKLGLRVCVECAQLRENDSKRFRRK